MRDTRKEQVTAQEVMCTARCVSDNASAAFERENRDNATGLHVPRGANFRHGAPWGYVKIFETLTASQPRKDRTPETVLGRAGHVYVASSLFLHRCYSYLKSYDTEAVHFVTGPQVDGRFVLDTLLAFDMSKRSWGMAAGDNRATHNLLQGLDEFGHTFTAYFHTHPGKGKSATRPSSVDLTMQQRLERGGYPTIGGIFSQDAHLRFFSFTRKFTIETYGLKIERKGTNVFRLT